MHRTKACSRALRWDGIANRISWLPGRRRCYSGDSGVGSPNLPQQLDLLERYRGLVTLGRIQYDEEQIRVVMQLRRLQRELAGYAPPAIASHLLASPSSNNHITDTHGQPWWIYPPHESQMPSDTKALMRLKSHAEELSELDTPRGLFLTGAPGTGKSFLIDLWFSVLPTPYKARKHYNELVLEIYRAVWVETQRRMTNSSAAKTHVHPQGSWNRAIRAHWKELLKTGSLPTFWTRSPSSLHYLHAADPTIAFSVARRLILHHWLLVFDEVQLLDVSGATLLADVLSWFWRMGGVLVGCSNKIPDDLYKNGVQRVRLEPFVEALKMRCPVVTMRSSDWRQVRAGQGGDGSWFRRGYENEFDEKLRSFSQADSAEPQSERLRVFGRDLYVPWSSGGVCKYTFSQLCDEPLGTADYLTLASNFHTIAITSIPTLKLSAKNQARRFILLIDALYEARCRLVSLAESAPEDLFFPDAATNNDNVTAQSHFDPIMAESVSETQDVYRPNVSSYDSPNMDKAPVAPSVALSLDTLSIFSGQDEQFAFKRALSRLIEMTSSDYGTEEVWSPLPISSRRWEGPRVSESSRVSLTRGLGQKNDDLTSAEDDFAAEVSHMHGPSLLKERPAAPRISNHHMWGIREDTSEGFGDGPKHRGRGPKVHRNSPSEKV